MREFPAAEAPNVPPMVHSASHWYPSTGTTQFSLYYRDASGAWYYWTSSPWFATATAWTQATFSTPPVPANAVGMTFGLGLIANDTLTTDDYSLIDPGTGSAPAAVAGTGTSAPSAQALSAGPTAAAPLNGGNQHQQLQTHARTSNLIPGQARGQASAKPGQRITVPEIPGTGRKTSG
jgi:hypothetical protein